MISAAFSTQCGVFLSEAIFSEIRSGAFSPRNFHASSSSASSRKCISSSSKRISSMSSSVPDLEQALNSRGAGEGVAQ